MSREQFVCEFNPCKLEAKRECTNCGAWRCEWHLADSPVAVEGNVVLVPVCHPTHAGCVR